MPRKTKTSKVTVTKQPTQNDIAQIIYSSFDLFANEVMTGILEKNDDLKLDTDSLKSIQKIIQGVQSKVKSRAVDQVLKYY